MQSVPSPLTESVQTYLASILRLRENGQLVPLSRLASTMNISPISVNQMCRKLQDQGLVTYVPYKGASLTPSGETMARRILRRHRLWEVFLVERLEMSWEDAHEAACQLEHVTPDEVIARLDVFLDHPRVNPQGDPIPLSSGDVPPVLLRPLVELQVGGRGYVIRCTGDETTNAFLASQGLRAGASFQVMAVAPESVLVEVNGHRVTLGRSLAAVIQVASGEAQVSQGECPLPIPPEEELQTATSKPLQLPLAELSVGQQAIVVRVGGEGRLRRRLLEMGVVPGEEITVERVAPLGDPVEFTVKGYRLSLRKGEAARILVEMAAQG